MSQFTFPPVTISSVGVDYEKANAATALPSTLAIIGGWTGTAITALKTAADGALQIDVESGHGLATEAKQDTIEATLTAIETDADTIAGAVTGTEMQVDIVASLPAGSNNIGDVDVLSVIPGVGATNLGKAIQSAQGTTDTGVPALVVRNDTLADLSGADGDYAPIQVNATGAVYTVLSAGTAVFGKLAANSGVDIGDVDVTSSALPTGAATSALQTSSEAILTTIDADTGSLAGCVSGTELQVDVVSGSVVVDTYSVVDFIDSTVAGYVADNGVIELSGTDTIPAKAASQLQLVSTSAAAIKKIQTVEDIGEYMGIFTGASTAETLACVLPLGGGEVSVEIPQSTRISIRALTSSTAITSGSLGINFLG